jgi:hypothetical protein
VLYVGLVILSLCSCRVGFSLEIAEANVCHVENGRPPNASASLLPTIPIVQIFYVLAAWSLNHIVQFAGYTVVSIYGCISIAVTLRRYRKTSAKLKALRSAVGASCA